jgi:hypothetical protein
MFLITSRAIVNASAWEMKLNLPGSLGSEPNHTVHDLLGVGTFPAFEFTKLISQSGIL